MFLGLTFLNEKKSFEAKRLSNYSTLFLFFYYPNTKSPCCEFFFGRVNRVNFIINKLQIEIWLKKKIAILIKTNLLQITNPLLRLRGVIVDNVLTNIVR